MADVSDNEELIATRKLHGLDDDLFKEDKIETGEYVRTNIGVIGKVIKALKNRIFLDCLGYAVQKKDIVKHSKIISEVIDVGDYVNGKLIHKIDKGPNYCYLYYGNSKTFVDYQIQTILTKESYMANCYKLGGRE